MTRCRILEFVGFNMIYFDNAATTRMSETAIKALLDVSQNNYGNASSTYSYGRKAKRILNESREIIARAIGAKESEIYFTSCGTESDNWAISQARNQDIQSIITSAIEHHAILNSVRKCEKEGIPTSYIAVDENCRVNKQDFLTALNSEKQLVSIMLQNNETGVVQSIRELSELVHKSNPNSLFHTDAVQAVGHLKINVKELDVDMLSASAHKFNGPKGVGFLFVREGLSISPLLFGGGQEKSLRSGTENVAGIYSMAKALEENISNLDANIERVKSLEERLLRNLDDKRVSYIINGEFSHKAAGILNISFPGIDGESLLNALDTQGICVSIGSACNSKTKERSYVLTAMNISEDLIDSSLRISIGRYNNVEEIDILANSICKYVKLIGKMNA